MKKYIEVVSYHGVKFFIPLSSISHITETEAGGTTIYFLNGVTKNFEKLIYEEFKKQLAELLDC